ncbi:MAG: helix-turn-helix domain-containing protein [Pirellulales bacterium]|nr:helix-turn-helix domain-containing protein [Pirellulales bacterium]
MSRSRACERLREGFVGLSEAKVPFRRLHCHDDIEIGVNEHHPVTAIFGGQRLMLPPNHLVVFWAARPHGPIETTPGGWAYGIHIPFPWILQWRLSPALVKPLLAGRVVLDPPDRRPAADLELVKNWVRLMRQDSVEAKRVVLLEVEARLRRLAIDLASRESAEQTAAASQPPSTGAVGRFEKMATLIARHFHEPLLIGDIAEAVRMKPQAAMRLFRQSSGMTIHECLMRHRVSNAQWLLATTDADINDVAAMSGFGSSARFYVWFQKVAGQSPAAYRRTLGI